MSTTLTPDRQTFRALVADVAARAKARLPEAVNGRVESAVKLVLLHDVTPQPDGTILVGSSSDPMKTYRLVGTTCECQDYVHGKDIEGWCQHRIAAGIDKRVRELQSTPVLTEPPVEPYPDNDPEEPDVPELAGPVEVPQVAPVTTPAPLPEAPVSITLKAMLHGHEVLVTLRGTDFASVREQVEAASEWLRSQAPTTAVDVPQCPIHHVAMKENHKDGRTWLSHKTAQGWCKGK